ncbi:MAG TPA: hypothetical protein VKK79_09665 [Candidatus Lokiarchaeia archaeon]|nr:hypothetical protein [Candidatus Lokiarchaeia archaeon]
MPWTSNTLETLVSQALAAVTQILQVQPNAIVLVCTKQEMTQKVIAELATYQLSQARLEWYKQSVIPFIIGKYFLQNNEIWLVDGKGDKWEVLIHELLHSVQKCRPNRERITDYLTFKLTQDPTTIDPRILTEWNQLEQDYGLKAIIARFLRQGDCEEF